MQLTQAFVLDEKCLLIFINIFVNNVFTNAICLFIVVIVVFFNVVVVVVVVVVVATAAAAV